MKVRLFALTATLVMMWSATATTVASDETDAAGQAQSAIATAEKPGATLSELEYKFEPVVDGSQITHDFPIKNTGSGPLAITKVKTG